MWDKDDPRAAIVIPDPTRDGSGVMLYAMSVQKTLTGIDAAAYNGEAVSDVSFVAVGAGALGSQVLANLRRGGWQPRAVVDADHMLPHNPARHLLFGDALGSRKAESVVAAIDSVVDEATLTNAVFRDVLIPDEVADAALEEADVLLDMSASVAVARRLAIDLLGSARRVSLYLNPTGTDSVLLSEDAARSVRLDHIELQYYWAVATRGELYGHLTEALPLRYGGGCRDVSSRIKQTSLAVHAGLVAAAFRRTVENPDAECTVWRLDEATGEVDRVVIPVTPMRNVVASDWKVFISEALLAEVTRTRIAALPNETGGVLIGSVDMERRFAYLVGHIPAPSDSKGWSTGYVRGSYGLQRAVATLCDNAGGHIKYIGEWHSHPDGATTDPSIDDKNAYRWFADALADESRPPIMLIVGKHDVRCVIDLIEVSLSLAA
jgi:integrative and conjugative element protein (TIGR02256 family)